MTPFVAVRNVFLFLLMALLAVDYFIGLHWGLYIILIIGFLFFVVVGSSAMKYNIFLRAYTSPDNAENKIAITFDDGPAQYTENVLDVLNKYNVKASFFTIGKNTESNPEIITRLHNEGHMIGNHSYSHHNFFPFFRKKQIADEIEKTNILIEGITGKPTNYFRPPYGVTNPAIAAAVKMKKMKVIGWNIRSFDTVMSKPEMVVYRIIQRLKPGSVILLHDNRKETAEILEAILIYAEKMKYKCVTIDEIFKLN